MNAELIYRHSSLTEPDVVARIYEVSREKLESLLKAGDSGRNLHWRPDAYRFGEYCDVRR